MTPRPDGLVHLVRFHSTDRGNRKVSVACGRPMPTYRAFDRLSGVTGWRQDVTCSASTQGDNVPSCLDNPLPWAETPDPAKKEKK